MATVAAIPPQPNGLAQTQNELAVYEKIVKLRDDIFAGVHPRLKVPANAVRNLSPFTAQASTSTSAQLPLPPSTASNTVLEPKVPGLNLSKHTGDVASFQSPLNGLSTKPLPISKPASGLDPIFLTKSDELVRAELQLHRQRLEKQLREQAENKRNEARTQPAVEEAKPDIDVTEVFERALELVKPITLSEIQEEAANASVSSFDENSFYSSRAPDSTPEDGENRAARRRQRKAAQAAAVDLEDEGEIRVQVLSDDGQQASYGPKPSGLGRRDSRAFPNVYQQPQDPSDRYSPPDVQIYDDLDDEPEYSPPEPAEPVAAYPGFSATQRSGHRKPSGRGHEQYSRRDSPTTDVRIVRNTITTPLAPQPARLSSLAGTKQSPLLQNRRIRQDGGMESERTSPETQTLPRKRRKVQDARKGRNKKNARSPGPTIKDEPVSPPPFHDVPPLGAGALTSSAPRSAQPVYIDSEPPIETRYIPAPPAPPAPEYQQRPATYAIEAPNTQYTPVRSVSRPIFREVVKDTQDLRRVASLQHLQAGHQAEYGQPSPYTEPHIAHPPSYAVHDRSAVRSSSVMYDTLPAPTSRQYVQDLQPSTSPVYRDQYVLDRPMSRAADMHAPLLPPPPPPPQPQRRIIVDEAGNRYYETIAPAREASMAPPRQIVRDQYDGGIPQYTRATTVFEAPREVRYVQDMPPPPQFSSRASVAPRTEGYERVAYPQREGNYQPPVQRAGTVQVVDYPPRQQPVYVEDRAAPREEYIRMSSVRPTDPYGHERIIERMQSVRPSERAVSVFPGDKVQAPREYVPVGQTQYAAPPPLQGAYYQNTSGTQVGLDGTREIRYSVVPQQRY